MDMTQLEQRLRDAASRFNYPPSPDVSRRVRLSLSRGRFSGIRLTVRVAAIVLVLLAAALAVPQVRALLAEFFQIGPVRVLPFAPTATPNPPAGQGESLLTATPRAARTQEVPNYAVSIFGFAGEQDLATARRLIPFTIKLPSYPPDLGAPDRVFVQQDGPMVILAWVEPGAPDRVRMSLHEIGPGSIFLEKYQPRVVLETQVNDAYALWVEGPYLVKLSSGQTDFRRLVEGNTLIWKDGDITYRLETNLTLAEAIQIAESLQ
ncbi:MAG TPA: hypothetical protein VGJ22_03670 [Anaerolineales bacterium]|jgi:hypothetical protein